MQKKRGNTASLVSCDPWSAACGSTCWSADQLNNQQHQSSTSKARGVASKQHQQQHFSMSRHVCRTSQAGIHVTQEVGTAAKASTCAWCELRSGWAFDSIQDSINVKPATDQTDTVVSNVLGWVKCREVLAHLEQQRGCPQSKNETSHKSTLMTFRACKDWKMSTVLRLEGQTVCETGIFRRCSARAWTQRNRHQPRTGVETSKRP